MINTHRRFQRLCLLTLICLFSLMNNGCVHFGKRPETAPPVQTIVLKAGVNKVKLVDQRYEREIDIAWNNDELGKLEQNQATPEIVRLSANKVNGESAQAPITVVVTQREPEAAKFSESVHIRQVVVKDARGFFVNLANDGQYHLKPGEKVRFEVTLDKPARPNITVDYLPRSGQMEANTTYIAPSQPGETDQVKIKVWNNRTGALLDMDIITIKTVDVQ